MDPIYFTRAQPSPYLAHCTVQSHVTLEKDFLDCGVLAQLSSFVICQISGSKWLEEQRVGEVSTRSGRGKHTTRNVSLLPLAGGGLLADTPGFNQPSLLKVTKHNLAQAFPEVISDCWNLTELSKFHFHSLLRLCFLQLFSCTFQIQKMLQENPNGCAFNNCLHIGEPGCVVTGDWERYPYYFQLLDEIKIREEFQLRMMGTKKEDDVRYDIIFQS